MPGPGLVEGDHAGERRQSTDRARKSRLLECRLDVGDEAGDRDEVEGAVAEDAVGDAQPTALRVGDLGPTRAAAAVSDDTQIPPSRRLLGTPARGRVCGKATDPRSSHV